MLADFVVFVQVKIVREEAEEKTFVDEKLQGVWKQVMHYLEDYGTEKEKKGATSWSMIKLYYKFGLSNKEVSTMRRCLSPPLPPLYFLSSLSLSQVHVSNPYLCVPM
jgi:hypothetical protein